MNRPGFGGGWWGDGPLGSVGLVLEGDAQLRPEEHLIATKVKILLDHFGNAQITECLLRGLHCGDRGVLP